MLPTAKGEALGRIIEDAERLVEQCLALERHLERPARALDSPVRRTLPAVSRVGALSNQTATGAAEASGGLHAWSVTIPRTDVRQLCETARRLRERCGAAILDLAHDVSLNAALPIDHDKPRVLVVDDSADTRDLVSTMLQLAGLEPVMACNGLEAVVAAHHVHPSVVLMDATMPVLNGIAATRLLKASDDTRHIPVIAHTAAPSACHSVASEKLFVHVLHKPAPPHVLVALVQRFAGE
jgi:CheY-like chemotaxis protein